jgi:hypothetical protein
VLAPSPRQAVRDQTEEEAINASEISGGGAQETTTGSISGRVIDAQGLPVPGASVTVTTPQGTRDFTSDSDGRFFAPFLTPGAYEITVALSGFRTPRHAGRDEQAHSRQRYHPLAIDRRGGGYRAARFACGEINWNTRPVTERRLSRKHHFEGRT